MCVYVVIQGSRVKVTLPVYVYTPGLLLVGGDRVRLVIVGRGGLGGHGLVFMATSPLASTLE